MIFNKFDGYSIQSETLHAGDYSLVGHDRASDDHSVMIERKKNCSEFVRDLCFNWDRFKNKAELLSKYQHRVILICGPENFQYIYDKGFTKVHPSFAYKRITELMVVYGIPTVFVPSQEHAAEYVFRLFLTVQKTTKDEN